MLNCVDFFLKTFLMFLELVRVW